MRRSLLEERLACCRQAGLAVKAVAVNPIAALNAWDAQRAASGPVRGAGGTTALLIHDERFAEWVVRTSSSVQVIPVTSDSPERFAEELAASWESLRAQPEGAPTPVWVSGASELVARVQAQAGAAGLPLEPFELSRVVDTGRARAPAAGHALAAVGLALQALNAAPVALNLLEGLQREAQGRLVGRTAAALSVVLLLAAFGFGVSGMMESRARRAQLLQALERREKLYQTLRPEIRTRLQRQQRIERYCAQLERLTSDSSLVTRLLGQLAATLPESVWLTSLECSKNGLLSGLLEGRATSFQDVTQFFDRLKSVAGMTTVKPVSTSVKTDETTGKEVIAFSVQIQRPLAALEQPPESPTSDVGSRQSDTGSRR
jgi:Tfp pilus assembly protein PilN